MNPELQTGETNGNGGQTAAFLAAEEGHRLREEKKLKHSVDLNLLSKRETQIFGLLIKGTSSREMADQLGVSLKTIETHRSHMNRKLGVHSSFDLLRKCLLAGAIDVGHLE